MYTYIHTVILSYCIYIYIHMISYDCIWYVNFWICVISPAGSCVFRYFFRFCQAQLFVPEGDSAAVRRLRQATASEAEISGNLEGRWEGLNRVGQGRAHGGNMWRSFWTYSSSKIPDAHRGAVLWSLHVPVKALPPGRSWDLPFCPQRGAFQLLWSWTLWAWPGGPKAQDQTGRKQSSFHFLHFYICLKEFVWLPAGGFSNSGEGKPLMFAELCPGCTWTL